jgi:hypothetical protein
VVVLKLDLVAALCQGGGGTFGVELVVVGCGLEGNQVEHAQRLVLERISLR